MTNTIRSHENNKFDINTTPFLDAWKSTLLAQAKVLGIAVEPATTFDLKAISATIKKRLFQQNSSVKQLKHIVNTNDNFAEVLTAQEQLYLQKAKFYNIELDQDQWCGLTDLHMFDAVDSWEQKLKEALFLGVNWRMNNYDPDALELAIEQQEELCAIDSSLERQQANAYYYSTRGC